MVELQRESKATCGGVSRRAILKGVATVGFAGTALTGTASANSVKKITFRAAEGESFSFQLIVTGEVQIDGGIVQGVVVEDDVQVARNVIQGSLSDGGTRSFKFTGEISVLQLTGRGKVLLNGEVIRDTTEEDERRLPKEVIVSSPNTDELLNYVFEVTGDLEKLEPDEDSGRAKDEVIRTDDRVRVEGAVSTGDDRFAFSGEFIPIKKPPQVKFDIRERE